MRNTQLNYNGYVLYFQKSGKYIPFGVVSKNHECIASICYIPKKIKDYVISIEDKRFYKHNGIDFKAIIRAFIKNIKSGKIVQGGSTITQQLARNLLRDNRKSFYRKLRETFKAIQLELTYSKDEILHLYFNNVYFGKNLIGLRSAALYYYSKEIMMLSNSEVLSLITLLRGPNYYLKYPEKILPRFRLINTLLFNNCVIGKHAHNKNIKHNIKLQSNNLETVKDVVVNYITKSTNDAYKSIVTTIDADLQKFAKVFVEQSKYPISIIAFRNNDVTAFSSSYGSDYPFVSKSNVGSTLKPFLYCKLKDLGVSSKELYNPNYNSLNWSVRESKKYECDIGIDDALYHSNNNAFINACNTIDINVFLEYLASILSKDITNFSPSSILGATHSGISMYELGLAYSNFFNNSGLTQSKRDCRSIMNNIFTSKLSFVIEDGFLKTGTTNSNKERYAVLGNSELTFVVLREGNQENDYTKDGNFLKYIRKMFFTVLNKKQDYKWS